MALQEHHDLADGLLLGPGLDHLRLALGADAIELLQPLGGLLDHLKHRLAEGLDQLLGKVRADALDHAGAEILLDAFERGGRNDPQVIGLELQAMGLVVDPPAEGFDEFAGGDGGSSAHDGEEIALALDLHPQHTEAALLAMEGDALDGAREALAGLARRWRA